ncbi:Type VI secretion system (T6SS), amidase effector protein 4 [Paraburkholderia fungorum]|uniref:Type VI secretion system (T6SS), amidase effector protein 4 n=1 Tax=Paraburkholderia fungorum TaxID=134537 RepID=A0A1H0Z2Q0_9BURK|nr:type VI secretion system amidase effector protein Tae4 [Paraburkholderia fungorum]SDQ21757.1 Type VI secretion system (T6SS), amidase effector protein 4 [Paraburkholderia fungorum]
MPNKKTVVQTNTTQNSIKEVRLKALTFHELWDNYVTGDPYDDPSGQYSNQCAIRMSATFHRVGIEMKSFSQKLIAPMPGKPTLGRIILDGKPTATRAFELAEWLKLGPIAGLAEPQDIAGPGWRDKVTGRTGMIFFFGYWQQDGDSINDLSGGHIDLWNGSRLTNNGILGVAENFLRFRLNRPTGPGFSDLSKSKQILFWEMK